MVVGEFDGARVRNAGHSGGGDPGKGEQPSPLFDGFTLHRDIPDRAHVELIDTRWIEPLVSEKAAAGYDEKLRPVLARKPLEQAENNYAEALLL